MCYNSTAMEKPLVETNRHLRDPERYEQLLVMNVASSTAIELGHLPAALLHALKIPLSKQKTKTLQKSLRGAV